jgi:pimeloyl-ACP methyl ester carboxylesterase
MNTALLELHELHELGEATAAAACEDATDSITRSFRQRSTNCTERRLSENKIVIVRYDLRMRLLTAALISFVVALASSPVQGVGRPGITPVACPVQTWENGDIALDALPGAKAFSGTYEGGIYLVEIPEKWNGELMLSAHGFTTNAGPQGSRLRVNPPTIRQHLIDEGFAWAASSYHCNGYVPGMGLLDTMSLVDLFTKLNNGAAARRVYLTGTSMGGHVTLLGMHEFPTSFAGGLAMCPAGPELFDYFTAVGAAAEVITGVQFKDPSTMQADTKRMAEILGEPASYSEKGRQLASVEINLSGGPRPFAVEGLASGGRFLGNISGGALAGGTSPSNRAVNTTHIKYGLNEQLGLSAAALDKAVRRKTADAAIRNPMGPFDELVPFDGKIERPLLTMHGTGDLYVPVHLEQILNKAVTGSGKQGLLVQRLYRIAGHCQFSPAEQATAFDDLVKWVREGVKPAGDNVFGDLRDAGRTFTTPTRPNDPGTLDIQPPAATR